MRAPLALPDEARARGGPLAAADRPGAGQLSVAGQRVDELRERALAYLRRDEIGLVFQAFQLMDELTAQENVELPALLAGYPPSEARAGSASSPAGHDGPSSARRASPSVTVMGLGLGLFKVAAHGVSGLPPVPGLVAAVLGTVLVVAALTSVPARSACGDPLPSCFRPRRRNALRLAAASPG